MINAATRLEVLRVQRCYSAYLGCNRWSFHSLLSFSAHSDLNMSPRQRLFSCPSSNILMLVLNFSKLSSARDRLIGYNKIIQLPQIKR